MGSGAARYQGTAVVVLADASFRLMRIALMGAFDVEDCDRLAIRRVLETELRRRLHGAVVTVLAPLGRLRPLALDGGRPCEPLAGVAGEGLAQLGARFDCILVCNGDPLANRDRAAAVWGHPDAAAPLDDPPDPGLAGCPVIHLDLWREAEALPPLALLLPRLLEAPLRERRAAFLRVVGWAWEAGSVLIVQGGTGQLALVDALAAALAPLVEAGEVVVQLAAAGALDGEQTFAEALDRAMGGHCRRPTGVVALEDLAALVGVSTGFLGPPGVGLWLAAALGVPAATLPGGGGGDLLDELGVVRTAASDLTAAIRGLLEPGAVRPDAGRALARLDRRLDGFADAIRSASPDHPAAERSDARDAMCRAHDALGRRLLAERRALGRDLETRLRESRDEADLLRADLAEARDANDAIVGSRTWRYSQPVRGTLSRLRQRRR